MPALSPYLVAYAGAAVGLLTVVNIVARHVPVVGVILRLASWALIAVLLVGAIQQRSLFDPYFARLTHFLRLDRDEQEVSGKELRIKMAADGHFWVHARIGGVERRMLIDSGATITALSVDTAEAAGLKPDRSLFPVILKTANGPVTARTSSISTLRVGNILARHVAVVVSPAFGDTEVIGMNFLSRLKSWRVEGNTLILVPHHPQDAETEERPADRT